MSKIDKKMDIEAAINELDRVVEALEGPADKLEDYVELYEKAGELLVFCYKRLSDAKLKITQIDERIAQVIPGFKSDSDDNGSNRVFADNTAIDDYEE